MLAWLKVSHNLGGWEQEVGWIINICKQKGWKKIIIQCAFTETLHKCWKLKNIISFGGKLKGRVIENKITAAG